MTKVLLINPPRFKGIPVIREVRCAGTTPVSVYPPIRLAYMAAFLAKNNIEVDLLDANGYNYDFKKVAERIAKERPGVIIFTCSPTTMTYDLQVARIAKEIDKNIVVALDDSHIAPATPDKVMQNFAHLDILIRGESEFTALDLIKNLNCFPKVKGISYRLNTKVVNNPPREPGDLDTLPAPAYQYLPYRRYYSLTFARRHPMATIITSVGCPFRCSFCLIGGATIWRGYGKDWRSKSPYKVIDEIEYLISNFGIRSFYFFDETFTIDKKRVIDICEMIKKKNIKIEWSCNSRTDTVDGDMLNEMRSAGCWNICYGVETASDSLLNNIHKGSSTEKAKEVFRISHELHLRASASFMVGLPGENWETVKQTLRLAKELDPDSAQFVITTPYPGTSLYESTANKGFLKKEYTFFGFDAYALDSEPVLRTEALDAQELLKAQKRIYQGFYLRPSFIFRTVLKIRSLDDLSALINFRKYI